MVVNHSADGALNAFVLAWQRFAGDPGNGALDADDLPAIEAGGLEDRARDAVGGDLRCSAGRGRVISPLTP